MDTPNGIRLEIEMLLKYFKHNKQIVGGRVSPFDFLSKEDTNLYAVQQNKLT